MNTDQTRKQIPHSRRWRPSFRATVVAVVLLGEIGVLVEFMRARAAYQFDTTHSGCPDECLGTFFEVVFWAGMIVVWPLMAVFCSWISWLICQGIAELARRMRR
jgi:hypothetical protein